MIEADAASLGAALRYEGAGVFPHLYAPLPLAAVRRAIPVPLDAAGRHLFPADIP
jgi:uncharacterized protein (DUF952 family)